MKKLKIFGILFLFMSFLMAWSACSETKEESEKTEMSPEMKQQQMVQRGEYLVTVIGCRDCHTPKRMGPRGPEDIPELALSGYQADNLKFEVDPGMITRGLVILNSDFTATAGPWGISYAANLTTHATGLGNWSYEQFKKAMTEGKAKGLDGGRMLLPPMPWMNFKHLTDEDLRAIFAYLQSIPPVDNLVPAPVPFDMLAGN